MLLHALGIESPTSKSSTPSLVSTISLNVHEPNPQGLMARLGPYSVLQGTLVEVRTYVPSLSLVLVPI